MQVAHYLGLVRRAEEALAEAFEKVGKQHAVEIDVLHMCKLFRSWSLDHEENLKSLIEKNCEECNERKYRYGNQYVSRQ